MAGRQKLRAEETRQAIVAAAGELFAERGFEAVTIRDIARAAGCSHTTIYIYFKDKEALLHELSMAPLQSLQQELAEVLADASLTPDERLKRFVRAFITFCLANRNAYSILFMAQASRVDEAAPALAVQQQRNDLFDMLRQAVGACLPPGQADEQVLAYARICFYTIHGVMSLYMDSQEPLEALLTRLTPTFDLSVDVLLAGFKQAAKQLGAELT